MTHNETRVSNERLAEMLHLNPPGSPFRQPMTRDVHSALLELQELRANPSPSDGEVSDKMVERVWRDSFDWPTPLTRSTIRRVLTAALQSKRGQP